MTTNKTMLKAAATIVGSLASETVDFVGLDAKQRVAAITLGAVLMIPGGVISFIGIAKAATAMGLISIAWLLLAVVGWLILGASCVVTNGVMNRVRDDVR